MCGQLPFIARYLGAQRSFEYFKEVIVLLLSDDEKEVMQTSVQAFSALAEFYLTEENDLTNKEQTREWMHVQFTKLLRDSKL